MPIVRSLQRSRFVVLGGGGCGTTMLADELENHPDCRCWREPFAAKQHATPGARGWWWWNEKPWASHDEYFDYLLEQATEPCVGWKATVVQVATYGAGDLIEAAARRFPKLVRIRRSLRDQIVSRMLAELRGYANTRDGDRVQKTPLFVPKDRLAVQAQRVTAWENALDAWQQVFPSSITVRYEDYLEDREAFLTPILDFLGLAGLPAPTRQVKVVPGAPLDWVKNREEVEPLLPTA